MQKLVFLMSIMVAGILSYQAYQTWSNDEAKDLKATYLPAGDFVLERDGQAFNTESLRGTPYILYFGFASCPDVCPLGLTTIRDALNSRPEFKNVPALFVSVDPERDTAKRLKEYAAFFHPNIVPLRGDVKKVAEVAKQYGTYFMKAPLPGQASTNTDVKETDPNAYTVDHTAYYFIIDAEGQLKRVLEHNAKANDLAQALAEFI